MPNLKDIRRRIKSVKSTQKITQAMRMVAAAKVKRAENRVKAGRPYAHELRRVFKQVYQEMHSKVNALSGSRYAELFRPRPVKNVGIIVLSSDRGLCGSYNSSIIRQALRLDKEIKARGLTPKYYLVGNKAIQAFARYSDSEVLGRIANMTAAPSVSDANLIAETMSNAFLDGQIDSIDVLSTLFISMISYKIRMTPVIPVKSIIDWEPDLVPAEPGSDEKPAERGHVIPAELELEPSPKKLLDHLVPMYLSNIFYNLLLEAAASELAARMTAMSNATNNAGEMIDRLTILYNKARQASITQEILEVVSGAEALR